jgi:ankyrin repeat protein
MGLFCVNMHFRTSDDGAVSAALDRRGAAGRHVLPAKGGWVSAYEELASQQDESRIRDLAGGLSRDLRAVGIAFLVHDSDIACYWLFERGKLLDEYNSCPDYFDADPADNQPSGGRPEVLLPFCKSGIREEDLAAILSEQTVFADDIAGQLAEALGIDPELALSDYRDFADGDGPDGFGGDDDDGGGGWDDGDSNGGDSDDGGPQLLRFPTGMAQQLARQLGATPPAANADPQATALVEAAAAGDTAEIDQLLDAGAGIDIAAPAPLPEGQPAAGLGQMFPGGLPQFPMTPLLAAVLHQQQSAADRLLDRGADPNVVHPLFGTPLHVATGAGNVDLLRLLIDRGGKVSIVNRQGQTPLAVVAASRATIDRLAQARSMMASLGMKPPAILDQLSNVALPTAGWDACEKLLVSRGAI